MTLVQHLRFGIRSWLVPQVARVAALAPDSEPDSLRHNLLGYQAGDWEAYQRFYGILAPEIDRYLASLPDVADRRADLVQATFLQIHRARRTYDPRYPVRPWALAIARAVYDRARTRAASH